MKAVLPLLTELIATPSQALADELANVVGVITRWLDSKQVAYTLLGTPGKPDAIAINPPQSPDDEVWMLNACVDTAPIGDRGQWAREPFKPVIENGWLYGRGSSDSKAGVALFCELARRNRLTAKARKGQPQRRVTVVFDCDEHSGRFGGIRAATARYGFPKHCSIGYPGLHEIVSGSRGFHRSVVTLRGSMGHSGAETVPAELAADKLQRFLKALEALSRRKAALDPAFPIGPRASVTGLRTSGAKTFSVTASKIEAQVDIRLTPRFDAAAATAFLDKTLLDIGRECGNEHPSTVSVPNTWPPYQTPDDALLPRLLQSAAAAELGHAVPLVVCGPSNIGNLLAQGGTQVLSGFGVEFKNAHGPDECIRVATLAPVFRVYQAAVKAYVGGAV